jgi:hypothetical protein
VEGQNSIYKFQIEQKTDYGRPVSFGISAGGASDADGLVLEDPAPSSIPSSVRTEIPHSD